MHTMTHVKSDVSHREELRPYCIVHEQLDAPARIRKRVEDATPIRFTGRDKDVFHCLIQAMGNKEAAYELGLSEHTFKSYVSRLLQKLGMENRTQLALYAIRESI